MTIDPAVIAALDGATVAELRRAAVLGTKMADLQARSFGDGGAVPLYLLAALAYAAARIADTSDVRIEQSGRADYLILDIPMPETHAMGYGGCDLIPALAALLRSEP